MSKNFNEEFFCKNFDENPLSSKKQYTEFYNFDSYKGDIGELIDLYIDNENILNSQNRIFYNIDMNNACTYLNINLTSGIIYLVFETHDQFLYEHLWLNSDLTPQGLQDCQSRIGKEKMIEMFERIKDIKIPTEIIPTYIIENQKILIKK